MDTHYVPVRGRWERHEDTMDRLEDLVGEDPAWSMYLRFTGWLSGWLLGLLILTAGIAVAVEFVFGHGALTLGLLGALLVVDGSPPSGGSRPGRSGRSSSGSLETERFAISGRPGRNERGSDLRASIRMKTWVNTRHLPHTRSPSTHNWLPTRRSTSLSACTLLPPAVEIS